MSGSAKLNHQIISVGLPAKIGADESDNDLASETRQFALGAEHHRSRVDRCLAMLVPEFSRSYLQQLILQGDVSLSGDVCTKASSRVSAGQVLLVCLRPTPQAQSFKAEPVPLNIVYEDDHLLVLNKAAGVVVHPAAGNWSGTLLNGLLHYHAGAADLPRAGIVHRLDKDTSGLMMVGKSRSAVEFLTRAIAAREVTRLYLALAEGSSKRSPARSVVNQYLGRDPVNRLRMAVLRPEQAGARPATTLLSVLACEGAATLFGCKLMTGRTHQIRVHLAFSGHPIAGDVLYGGHLQWGMLRQALHATRLEFLHPVSGTPLAFFAPPPPDMLSALELAGLTYNPQAFLADIFDPTTFDRRS